MRDLERPLVSFIIPVLNGERDIARCLLSIQKQQCPEAAYEVQVMDNGSTDQTPQIVRRLGCAMHVVPRVHVSALRNRGAAIARGDYLAFVDADVELAPHWLQSGLATFQEAQVVASGCFPGVPAAATWVQQTWDLHQRGRRCDTASTPVAWLPSMNLLVRREVFLAVGGFNERLETAEDVDLCYRLGTRGTILSHPAMTAMHWGEARDLGTFWRKETWRGTSNMSGVLAHGLRWDELPSLGYPLYMLNCALLFGLSCVLDLWHQQVRLAPLSLLLPGLPALALAADTARRARRSGALPRLFLLYLVYGLARAFAVIRPWLAWPK